MRRDQDKTDSRLMRDRVENKTKTKTRSRQGPYETESPDNSKM